MIEPPNRRYRKSNIYFTVTKKKKEVLALLYKRPYTCHGKQ